MIHYRSIYLILCLPCLAHAACNQNDSRLTNCDSPIGTTAYTHVEIERKDCVTQAIVFQPSQSGEPTSILTSTVSSSATSGEEFQGAHFELKRTDPAAPTATGEFKAHLNADVGGKKISEDLKCSL